MLIRGVDMLTSNSTTNLNNLRERESIASDAPRRRPHPLVVNCLCNSHRKVCYRCQGHNGILMAVHHNRPAMLEIEDALQRVKVTRCFVGVCKIFQEQPRLE